MGFSVRHLMVSKVKGTFESFTGTLTIAENPLDSSVVADLWATSWPRRTIKTWTRTTAQQSSY